MLRTNRPMDKTHSYNPTPAPQQGIKDGVLYTQRLREWLKCMDWQTLKHYVSHQIIQYGAHKK